MRQFINGNEETFNDLEERAQRACVRFPGQEMPTGCSPNRADVGFEINPDSGKSKLWVSKGIRYSGRDSQIRQWLAVGHKEFLSFKKLKDWLNGPIAQAFSQENQQQSVDSTAITNLPVIHQAISKIDQPLYLDEDQLFNCLSRKVRGQDQAIKSLSGVISRHTARCEPTRPSVVFAVGPTGVGKTKTAESLADVLSEMGTEYAFLRLDMTEYQEPHRVSQLIGSPQGYIGHGEGSQLVDALRANPKTVILFDEIEKAHPAILKVLMNAMDAGRLSTASRSSGGHQVDCRSAVFFFTGNLEATEILNELTNRKVVNNRAVEDEVCRRHLKASGLAPEIVGRIGRFLVFFPLSAQIRAEIMAISITEIAREYGLEVSFIEPTVIIDILKRVGSQNFGVRPERFLVDDLLGGIFAKTASEQTCNPIEVVGPPFGCRKAEISDRQTEDSNKGNNKKEEPQ